MARTVKTQELSAAVEALRDQPLSKIPDTTPLVFREEVAVAEPDDGRIEYTVTASAPPRVAGRRVKPGETIRLTEPEARAELLALHITPPSAGLSAEQVKAISEIL